MVIENVYRGENTLDKVSEVFQRIIREKESSFKGDHFGEENQSDKIWNSSEKMCLSEP